MAAQLTPQGRDHQATLIAEGRVAESTPEQHTPLIWVWVLVGVIVLLTLAVGCLGGRIYERAIAGPPVTIAPIVIPPEPPLLPNGGQEEARLGVYYRMLEPGDPFEVSEGALIIMLLDSGTPAERAGLQPGDIITQVGSNDLHAAFTLSDALWSYSAGESVRLRVLRDGRYVTLRATLGSG